MNSGKRYGVTEIDCCGCDVTKCLPCPPPLLRSQICPDTGKLPKCYTYNDDLAHENTTGCFLATCVENSSDAPPDEV